MVRQYQTVLSNESIEWLVLREEVREAKARILAKTSTTSSMSSSVSDRFTVPLTPTIRSELFETFGLQLSNVTTIPMRWIVGDTPAHHDSGSSSFSNTYLVYLTSSPGNLVVDGASYPIQRGYGYVFSEGLSHETVGTTVAATVEPRLLLGPMSEMGFAVGAAGFYYPGGTTVYIRQIAVGQIVEYSTDQTTWFQMYWASYIQNTNTAAGVLTIEFITDITIDATIGGNNGYLVCSSENIQIGSRVLKPDGTRPVITINGITNYPGFIQNGTGGGGANGYNNIFVMNLEIRATGATDLVNGGGWVGQGHFGNNTTASSNIFMNCHSTGIVSNNSGGIVGHYSGPIKCVGCSSSGLIHEFGGGIIGSHSPSTTGQLRCESCWTTGAISHAAGGITGRSTGAAVIINCYSTGIIAENAGGISGHESGTANGGGGGGNTYTVSECYSTGTINDLGGGIIGSDSGAVIVANCYSIGAILATGGGILGRVPGSNSTNKSITNCYTTGTTQHAHSYIVANYTNVNTNLTVHTGTITLANNYAESANASSGWSNTRANTVLTGVPASSNVPVGVKWVYAGMNTPYELYMMGHTPYPRTVVSGAPTSPVIVRLFTSSAAAGTSSAPALIAGRSYSILQIARNGGGGSVGSYPTITMNPTTGAITTTRETVLGTYTITLRNNGSYHITVYELTVTEAEARPYNPCRFFGLFTNNAQVFYKSHSLSSGGVGSVRNHRLKARRT